MTFLMVEVLATGALHQLVAALLGEVLAHTAAAVVEVQVRILVITPGVAQINVIDVSTTWWRCGRRGVAGGGQSWRVETGPLGFWLSLLQHRQVLLQSVKILLLLFLKFVSV